MAILASTPLGVFVKQYEDAGVLIGPFRTKTNRFAIREYEVEDGKPVGYSIVCNFARSMNDLVAHAANITAAKEKALANKISAWLHAPENARRYQVCDIEVTDKDVREGHFTADQIGTTFSVICKTGSVVGSFDVPKADSKSVVGAFE